MKNFFLWAVYYFFLAVDAIKEFIGFSLNHTVGLLTGKDYNNPESISVFFILFILVVIVYFTIKKLFTLDR